MYTFFKRVIDIFFCIIAFPFFLIILFFVYIAIKLDDGGPIFYRAPRIGKNCKEFNMIKFRSMKVDAENILNEDGSTYNAKDDPRVTRIGSMLRESSIDETPQLFNVLFGEMSAIGPRASAWNALLTYEEDELDKMKVRPGITGYTQAYYRNGLSVREKRLMDAWYANNISPWLDVRIFFKTIQTIVTLKNVYTNGIKGISENNTATPLSK